MRPKEGPLPHEGVHVSDREFTPATTGCPTGGTTLLGVGKPDDRLAFEALSEAVLQIASETQVEPVLLKLVHTARELIGAKYAALGVPDGRGGFSKFLTSGMSDELIDAIGPLPRTHGLLGAMLEDTTPYRTEDIRDDERFEWWPREHPEMTSFLGVPIVAKGTVLGAFYLTNEDDRLFSDADQKLIELFAAHAAIAIENASLFERSRELTVIEERNRLARDLHDSVVQTLFSLALTAEAAKAGGTGDVDRVNELAKDALEQLRSIVFELRPADLAADGLIATLTKHADVLRRVFGQDIDVQVVSEKPLDAEIELELFRIASEAQSNALKHARASRIVMVVDLAGDPARIEVTDDGVGFDPDSPGIRARHLGLTSMEERAAAIGAKLRIDAAPGRGTTVSVELPIG
jgi:signal transduction histidine kinase